MKLDNYAVAEAPRLGVRGWLRWIWRQVTSMRVALILLLLLALASIPGSILPQYPQDRAATLAFLEENGWWGRLLDATGFLDVFGSAWFTAIYVLLFASLIGCILPRIGVYWRQLRAAVPPVPRRLDRFDLQDEAEAVEAREAIERASVHLRRRGPFGWRVRVEERGTKDGREIALSATHESVREAGNLLFHLALVGILLAVAAGSLLTYRAQAIVVEGESFTNAVVDYDTYEAGALFDESWLEPFTLSLDSFDVAFTATGRAEDFTANVTLAQPGEEPESTRIQVNRPLQVDGGKIYLQGNGYAPAVTVVDADGEVAFSGAVPFLPQDAVYTSTGVVKVPDVTSGEQLGFVATLLPTAVDNGTTLVSAHPDLNNPAMLLRGYSGDLGLDAGVPQNVYVLDESQLSPLRDSDDDVWSVVLVPGETVELPDGLGSFTWEATPRFAAFDLRTDPSLPYLLVASILALVGLSFSLFAPRRRLWLVAVLAGAGADAGSEARTTMVRAAMLAPEHDAGAADEMRRVLDVATGRVRSIEEDE